MSTPATPASPTTERRWREDLDLAHAIADQVDPVTRAHFERQDFEVQTKPDLTPVTDADRRAERMIRESLSRARARDCVLGEEFGQTGRSPRQWVIDPIDGTKNFVRGVPVWATLIGLVEDGEVVVGLVSAPALGRRWWAVAGGGAWTGRSLSASRRLRVSGVSGLEDASLSYASLSGWVRRRRLGAMLSLMRDCWRTRAYGDFWSYMLVAEGAVDLAAEPELELYDMAALVPIVVQAGGRFTSLAGEAGPWGGDAVATNGLLHDVVLERLAAETD